MQALAQALVQVLVQALVQPLVKGLERRQGQERGLRRAPWLGGCSDAFWVDWLKGAPCYTGNW